MRWEFLAAPRTVVLCALALLPLATACDDGTSTDNAMVQVQVTDAPSDMIQSAVIWVSRVYLQGGPGNEADTTDTSTKGKVDLFNNPSQPFQVDLLVLKTGLVANLTQPVAVEPGSYKTLRIVVDSAQITLKQGFTFEGGGTTMSLKIPSGSSSGVKVDLNQAITSEEGTTNTLLVDFDVDQNFVIQGGSSATAVQGILFTPRIKELKRTIVEGTTT